MSPHDSCPTSGGGGDMAVWSEPVETTGASVTVTWAAGAEPAWYSPDWPAGTYGHGEAA